jgi:hypothetical protein
MKGCWPWILLGAGVYLYYRGYRLQHAEEAIDKLRSIKPLKEPMPQGAVPTGRTKTTTDTSRPGDITQRVGYAIRDFGEIILPDGSLDWIEIDRRPGVSR